MWLLQFGILLLHVFLFPVQTQYPPPANFQMIVWIAPSRITRFESTMIVPPRAAPLTLPQRQFVWPGLKNAAADQHPVVVLQTVIQNINGQWQFYPEYCCDPNLNTASPLSVSPGDELNTVFLLDSSLKWDITLTLIRGGSSVWQGGVTFDPSQYPDHGESKQALLAIELQGGAVWDWGDTVWKDISIEAEASDSSWCTNPVYNNVGNSSIISQPVAQQNGGRIICCIPSVTMHYE